MTHLGKCKAEHPDYRFILSTHIPTGKGAGYHSNLSVAVSELGTITTWVWLSGSWVPLQLKCGWLGQIVSFGNHSFSDDSQCCLHGCLYVLEILFICFWKQDSYSFLAYRCPKGNKRGEGNSWLRHFWWPWITIFNLQLSVSKSSIQKATWSDVLQYSEQHWCEYIPNH